MLKFKTTLGKMKKPNFKPQKDILSSCDIKSEHDLQKRVVARLRAHNFLCFCTDVFNGLSFLKDVKSKAIYKQHMISMGAAVGQPDLIVLHKGKATFIEFKFNKGKKTAEQEAQCLLLESMGYEVLEWRTEQQCIDWIVQHYNNKAKQ